MNEELQSSNEELEAAKEEVESLNEELRTVNAELEAKVAQLSEANDDMKNLLESTDVATLFLGEDMRIKRFTAAARQLVALRPSDVGRPINELATNLEYDQLTRDAEEVLETLAPKDVEVRTKDGYWYVLRIMPYRTTQNVISGLVCTFRDHQRAKRLELSEGLFRNIVQTIRDPLVVLDSELRIVSANNGFYTLQGQSDVSLEGYSLLEIGDGQWNDPRLRQMLEEVLPEEQAFQDLELNADFGTGQPQRLLVNARQLSQDQGAPAMILLVLHAVAHEGGSDGDSGHGR